MDVPVAYSRNTVSYTATCQRISGHRGCWIGYVQAHSPAPLVMAIEAAKEACAADWSISPEEVHVVSLVEGVVDIAFHQAVPPAPPLAAGLLERCSRWIGQAKLDIKKSRLGAACVKVEICKP